MNDWSFFRDTEQIMLYQRDTSSLRELRHADMQATVIQASLFSYGGFQADKQTGDKPMGLADVYNKYGDALVTAICQHRALERQTAQSVYENKSEWKSKLTFQPSNWFYSDFLSFYRGCIPKTQCDQAHHLIKQLWECCADYPITTQLFPVILTVYMADVILDLHKVSEPVNVYKYLKTKRRRLSQNNQRMIVRSFLSMRDGLWRRGSYYLEPDQGDGGSFQCTIPVFDWNKICNAFCKRQDIPFDKRDEISKFFEINKYRNGVKAVDLPTFLSDEGKQSLIHLHKLCNANNYLLISQGILTQRCRTALLQLLAGTILPCEKNSRGLPDDWVELTEEQCDKVLSDHYLSCFSNYCELVDLSSLAFLGFFDFSPDTLQDIFHVRDDAENARDVFDPVVEYARGLHKMKAATTEFVFKQNNIFSENLEKNLKDFTFGVETDYLSFIRNSRYFAQRVAEAFTLNDYYEAIKIDDFCEEPTFFKYLESYVKRKKVADTKDLTSDEAIYFEREAFRVIIECCLAFFLDHYHNYHAKALSDAAHMATKVLNPFGK